MRNTFSQKGFFVTLIYNLSHSNQKFLVKDTAKKAVLSPD